ncbi:MAG: sensor histidine kinase [Pirellulaceae bacterium]
MNGPLLRMIAPSAVMSVVLLALGGVAALYLNGLQKSSTQLLIESIAKIEAAEELEIISHELRYELRRYVTSPDESGRVRIHHLQEGVDRWLTVANQGVDTDREQALLDQIKHNYEQLFEDFEHFERRDEPIAQMPLVVERLHSWAEESILKPAGEFRDFTLRQAADASARHQEIADRMGMGLMLLGSCGAVAGLLLGYGLARGIHRSIAQLTIPIRDAAGRLNEVVGPITLSSGETFGELETALQCMADRIGTVVSQLHTTQLAALRAQQLASMGQLAAGLAHELRNPLTAMKMLVQPLSDDELTVQLDIEDQRVLCQEIERLERTIQTFLDYARPPKIEQRRVDLCELLLQTVEFVTPPAHRSGVEIRSNLSCGRVMVQADAGQMRQLLLNLLLNAIEASRGMGTIDVRMFREEDLPGDASPQLTGPGTPKVTIEVADRGCGLPADLGERIFEPFVSTKEGGTGLGLPICKRIVEEHGGTITAQTRPGGGAVFTVELLVAGAIDVPHENESPPQPSTLRA